MTAATDRSFARFLLGASSAVALAAIVQTFQQLRILGVDFLRSKWVLWIGLLALNVLAGGYALWRSRQGGTAFLDRVPPLPRSTWYIKAAGALLLIGGFALVWVVRLRILADILPQLFPTLWFFIWLSLLEALGLRLLAHWSWPTSYAIVLVSQAVAFQIYGHVAGVSDYPFSIGYSEGGRHYYASLFFAPSLYGVDASLPFLHPSRYLLMSVPFLVKGLPLVTHRAWQSLLWMGLTWLAGWLLARRLQLKRPWLSAFIAAWAFLFFLQGAVYYHLQVVVILVLGGVSARHPRRSLAAVVLASAWAGISRINWFPVPAMLAAAIYVLETPLTASRSLYWRRPVAWMLLGLASALASQWAYALGSRSSDLRVFASSVSSALLWDRLLPNSTFSMGILPGIAIVILPLSIGVWQIVSACFKSVHPHRWAFLAGTLSVLFLGGLVVSVKIGGGADLHNLDAFLVCVAIIASSLFAGRVAVEPGGHRAWGKVGWPVILWALLVPAGFALAKVGAPFAYDRARAASDLQSLRGAIRQAAQEEGEVLLISERQLLTFEQLPGVALVPEYEQMELMEMAMSGNRTYLSDYYRDLADHRFVAVIAEDQKFTERKRGAFVEENAAWVRYVGAPLLCAYKPVLSLRSANVQLFVPRPAPPGCPDPFLK